MILIRLSLAFGLAATLCFGQNAQLSGLLRDPSGLSVSGADVNILNEQTGGRRTARSNESGAYSLPSLNPGDYRITIRAAGFETIVREGIRLEVGDNARIDFSLKIGDSRTVVTVSSGPPMMNTESASVGTVIDRQFVDSLPMNGRSFQTLLELSPGVVMVPVNPTGSDQGQFVANGQRANTNYFTVDGVSANAGVPTFAALVQGTSGSLPATNIQGGFSNLVSVDALQEFRLETSSFDADYGRQPGAQVSLVTRSGTNALHGSAFEYFRNDKTDARDFFDTTKPPLRFNDFGGTFSGPLARDKTFFFFSYEGQRFTLPEPTLIAVVPSVAERANATNSFAKMILDAFPLPNGPAVGTEGAYFTASYSTPNNMDSISLRMDHHFNSKYSLFGRYNHAPSDIVGRSLTDYSEAQRFVQNTDYLTLGLSTVFNGRMVNDLRLNGTLYQAQSLYIFDGSGGGVLPDAAQIIPGHSTCGTCSYVINFNNALYPYPYPSLSGGSGAKNEARSINLVDGLFYSVGRHQFRAGFDYRYFSPVQSGYPLALGINFNDFSDLNSLVAPYIYVDRAPKTALVTPNYSAYAMDTWQVNQRLTLTYGIHWDVNPPPHIRGAGKMLVTLAQPPDLTQPDQSGLALAPPGTPLYNTDYHEFEPRLGAAYLARQAQGYATVIRGGFGLYSDLNSTPFAAGSWPYESSLFLENQSLPPTAAQLTLPAPNFTPSPTNRAVNIDAASPGYASPHIYEWNVSVQQALGQSQSLTLSYVASAGRDLVRAVSLNLGTGPNSPAPGVFWSPSFASLNYVGNQSYSDFNSLQAQFVRRLTGGLQVIANYTWSHSTDDSSSSTPAYAPGMIYAPAQNYGPSDFDIRHNFSAALTYNFKSPGGRSFADTLLRNWSANTVFVARTAFPFDVELVELTPFVEYATYRRADIVAGAPVWLSNSSAPGGKELNPAAFTVPPGTQQGDLGRNALRGFGFWQDDFSLHRSFHVTEGARLEFRAEAFNIFNHPSFANPSHGLAFLSGELIVPSGFGLSTQTLARGFNGGANVGGFNPLFQTGGPRSMQLALRFSF